MSCLVPLCLLVLVVCSQTRAEDVARPTFRPPLHGETDSPVCVNFTVGNWQRQEFFTPGYPGQYPNNTDCIHLLIAPKGNRIRLDFRDEFHIEGSADCKYDYAEFRDGPFGYSPLIGRYCGSNHPPMMETKSRFIWIHFRSDDSIEYTGFHAVYDYFPVGDHTTDKSTEPDFEVHEDEVCRILVDISYYDGFITHEDIPRTILERTEQALTSLDCTWAFFAPPGKRFKLKFESLEPKIAKCEDSFMEVYENSTAITALKSKKICESSPAVIRTSSNHAYVRAYGLNTELLPSFTIFFTVFQPGPCPVNMLSCDDDTCINNTLECNGNSNCAYSVDEQNCDTSTTVEPTREPFVIQYHTIIIGIVGGAILTIIFLAIVITCYQKNKEEASQRHALRHEERHAMEVEMTNLLNRSPQHGGLNAVAAHSSHSNPNGPVNHVAPSGSRQAMSNHVSHGSPQLAAHSQAMSHHNGHTGEPLPQLVHLQKPDRNMPDYTDHNGGSGTYRKFLEVRGQTSKVSDEHHKPKPSKQNQIPIVATIEKRPNLKNLSLTEKKDKYQGPVARDRTPSPRPDVVQEEKFIYPDSRSRESLSSRSPATRRMSNETERSDRSEVWKPITSRDMSTIPTYEKPQVRSSAPPQSQHTWTAPREHAHEPYSERRREGIGFEPIASDPSLYSRPTPKQYYPSEEYSSTDPSRRKGGPPAPPQRRTATLQHQSSAPMPPTEPASPPTYRAVYSRTPPAKPKIPQSKSSSNVTPSKSRQPDKTPAIFYTRPNPGRAERSGPKQHHPV